MSYQACRSDLLGAHVSQPVAEVLVVFLDRTRIYEATHRLDPDLRAATFETVDAIAAAAKASRENRRELADLGTVSAATEPVMEDSEVEGSLLISTLCVGQAASLLGLTDRRVRQLCVAGEITAEKVGPHWNIPRTSITNYLELKSLRSKAA